VKINLNQISNYFSVVILMTLLSCSKSDSKARPVVIGLQPNEKSSDHQTFSKGLSERIGAEVKIVISKDYDDLVKKFAGGEIDFAFFSPLNFLSAEKSSDAKVLLKKVYGKSEYYFSAVVVRSDSKISRLKDLEAKKIAFVDEKSTSGYLYPKAMLRRSGVDLSKMSIQFSGTHEGAVKDLLEGKVDAAGVWSDVPETKHGAWTEPAANAGKFRVIAYSDPIPNDAFVVRNAFFKSNQESVFKIMNALIDMSEKGENSLKKAFDTDRMATATSRHYDSVREAANEMDEK